VWVFEFKEGRKEGKKEGRKELKFEIEIFKSVTCSGSTKIATCS
jgi:hypothetical protein